MVIIVNIRFCLLRTLNVCDRHNGHRISISHIISAKKGWLHLFIDEETGSERWGDCQGHTTHKLVEFSKQTYCPNGKCIPWAQGDDGGTVLSGIRARSMHGRMHLMRCTRTHTQRSYFSFSWKRREGLRFPNVSGASLLEQHWGLGASLALSLQAPPGFPDRYCDWQEAGYPQGNPSSCLGDPCCRLLLNSAGNQAWQPPVGGWSRFPRQPSAASS